MWWSPTPWGTRTNVNIKSMFKWRQLESSLWTYQSGWKKCWKGWDVTQEGIKQQWNTQCRFTKAETETWGEGKENLPILFDRAMMRLWIYLLMIAVLMWGSCYFTCFSPLYFGFDTRRVQNLYDLLNEMNRIRSWTTAVSYLYQWPENISCS